MARWNPFILRPYHPYTEALLASVPVPDPLAVKKFNRLEGDVPPVPWTSPLGVISTHGVPRRSHLPDGGSICEREKPAIQKLANGPLYHVPYSGGGTYRICLGQWCLKSFIFMEPSKSINDPC